MKYLSKMDKEGLINIQYSLRNAKTFVPKK